MTTTATVRESAGMSIRPLTFEVTSESDPTQTYHVALPSCECPDFRYRRTRKTNPFCKHIRAAFDLAGWHMPEQTQDLDAESAIALLLRHGDNVSLTGARSVLRRARGHQTASVDLRGGLGHVTFRDTGEAILYNVQLPA